MHRVKKKHRKKIIFNVGERKIRQNKLRQVLYLRDSQRMLNLRREKMIKKDILN